MRRFPVMIFAAGLSFALATTSSGADSSFEFLFSASHVSDDHQLFLNLSVGDSGYGRAEVEPVLPRLHDVEVELPVVLFLARESGRSVDFIVDLRVKGLTWSVVFGEIGVSPGILFAGIHRDPGPPYGKAWGHWKKNPKVAGFSDSDIAGLIQVQIGHRLVGTTTLELARSRAQGTMVVTVVADKKGRPHGHGKSGEKKGKDQGKGKSKGKGKGKGAP